MKKKRHYKMAPKVRLARKLSQRKYVKKNRVAYNEYMRKYMKKYRSK